MPAFPFLDIFCPLVPPLARCLKFKRRRKSMLELCFKKCQNLSTSPHFTVPFDNSGGLGSTIHVDLSKATIYPTHELYLGKKHAYNGVDIKIFPINTRQRVKPGSTFSSCLQILSDKPQGSIYPQSIIFQYFQ